MAMSWQECQVAENCKQDYNLILFTKITIMWTEILWETIPRLNYKEVLTAHLKVCFVVSLS